MDAERAERLDVAQANPTSAGHRISWGDLRASFAGTHQDYTSGSIGRAIVLLAIPMVLEMFMQSAFAIVDVFFVGKLGADAVAVVGMTDSLLTLIFALCIGLSMGATAMVARRIGEKDPKNASIAAVQAIAVGVAFSIPLGLVGILFSGELLGLIGGSPEVVQMGSGFTAITLGSNITVMLLFLINAVFRGAGDAVIAMRVLALANLINIVLDPVLIFGWGPFPELGLEGAAIATTIGRATGVVYQLRELGRGRARIHVSRDSLRLDMAMMRRLVRVSLVGIFQLLIATASWVGLVRILALFGGTTLAGYTIAIRIIVFVLLPAFGMGNAAATLVGQNLGAGKPDRAERSVWITAVANMCFLGAVAVLFILYAEGLVGIFTKETAVMLAAVECLRIVSYSYVFLAFGMVTVQAFNGAGDTTTPTWINFICYWLLQIPLAYLLSVTLQFGPRGVFSSITIAQLVLAVIGVLMFRRGRWKSRVI